MVLLGIIGFLCFALFFGAIEYIKYSVDIGLSLQPQKGNPVMIRVIRNGETVSEQLVYNNVTKKGFTRMRNGLLGNASDPTNITKYISLSDDADANSFEWTKLPTEYTAFGLDRHEGTIQNGNETGYEVTYTFTCTADGKAVRMAGLHWMGDDDSNGNLFAAVAFNQVTLNTNDKLQVTWTINGMNP